MARSSIVGFAIVVAVAMVVPAAFAIVTAEDEESVPVDIENMIIKAGAGVPEVTGSYTPDADGNWSAVLENHGLRSVRIIVLDPLPNRPIFTQFIDFELRGAYPTGTVTSDPVAMREGTQYIIIAKDPVGKKGSYAILNSLWVPDQPVTWWTEPVTVAQGGTPAGDVYNSLSMATTENGIYLTSWMWPYGAVRAFSSHDGGATWTAGTGLPYSVTGGFSDICAYSVGSGQDVVLIVAGNGIVYKSVDNGLTYVPLAYLPLGGAYRWSYVSIGTGASGDSDIYVVGARVVGDYFGQFYLSVTKSTDGGATWSQPIQICPFISYYAQITSDGTNLYVIFDSLEYGEGYACLYAMMSSDWGATWTAPKLIFSKTYEDGGANPCTFEYMGGGKALVTISDHRPIYPDNRGTWAVLDLATLTLDVKGYVMGPDWQIDLGFCGHVTPDGRLAVAWLYRQPTSGYSDIRFTYGTNVGIELPFVPVTVSEPATTHFGIDMARGADAIYIIGYVYSYGPVSLYKSTDNGATWSVSRPLGDYTYLGEPGLCVYQENGADVVLLVSRTTVMKSTDGGASWSWLTSIPTPADATYNGWRMMTIGTNSSWTGSAPDNDIYVMGAVEHAGGYDIAFTKSTDGGLTWKAPQYLTSNEWYYNICPRMTSSGSALYAVYEIAGNVDGQCSLVTTSSSDWGTTWSAEKVLVQNDGGSSLLRPYGFQMIDSENALLSYVDEPTSYDPETTTGNCGYYAFSTMEYAQVLQVSGPDWMVHEGFCAKMYEDGLSVAWNMALEPNTYPLSVIMYTCIP